MKVEGWKGWAGGRWGWDGQGEAALALRFAGGAEAWGVQGPGLEQGENSTGDQGWSWDGDLGSGGHLGLC